MSAKYDEYLREHKNAVLMAYEWLRNNLSGITSEEVWDKVDHQVRFAHDSSKNDEDEYDAYDKYFYGNNKSYEVLQNFDYAWLSHIHKNKHHWQHWVLYHDDPNKPYTLLPIPDNYIIEMICDWWSFSWRSGNLYEIFQWYEDHKIQMQMNVESKAKVEMILDNIKKKLLATYHQDISEMVSDNNGEN